MNTLKSLSIAIAMAFALLLGMAAPVVAQETKVGFFSGQSDPFEAAHFECEKIDFKWCASVQTSGISLSRYLKVFHFIPHEVLEANAWEEDMLDEIIPVDTFFKVTSS